MEAITSTVKTSPVTAPIGLGTSTQQAPAKAQVKVETNAQPQQAERPITEKDVQKAINDVSNSLSESNESIGFNYVKQLGQMYVQVTDNVSGEVIREVPSQDFIKHKLAMQEMVGLLLDKEV